MAKQYGSEDPASLRDALAYDESISSFEVPHTEEYRYLGSFELSLPRGFPPERHFKAGREITDPEIADLASKTRKILSYREKVKFGLFADYDYLKQLSEQLGQLTQCNDDIYHLELSELELSINEPLLAHYRIQFRKKMRGKDIFPDPIFGSDLVLPHKKHSESKPHLIFGALQHEMKIEIGNQGVAQHHALCFSHSHKCGIGFFGGLAQIDRVNIFNGKAVAG